MGDSLFVMQSIKVSGCHSTSGKPSVQRAQATMVAIRLGAGGWGRRTFTGIRKISLPPTLASLAGALEWRGRVSLLADNLENPRPDEGSAKGNRLFVGQLEFDRSSYSPYPGGVESYRLPTVRGHTNRSGRRRRERTLRWLLRAMQCPGPGAGRSGGWSGEIFKSPTARDWVLTFFRKSPGHRQRRVGVVLPTAFLQPLPVSINRFDYLCRNAGRQDKNRKKRKTPTPTSPHHQQRPNRQR